MNNNLELESQARIYWNKTWNRFAKFHGMIAPSAKLVQHLINNVERKSRILDLGCGEGRNTIYLSQIGYNVLGIDLSINATKVLRNHFFHEELKGSCLTADARYLPLTNDSVEGILAHHLFDYMDKASFKKATAEAFRVLKAGGTMLMTLDSFSKTINDTNFVTKDDGSRVYVSGYKKGMLVRPFCEQDIEQMSHLGWEIIKNESTLNGSKIILLKKCVSNC